MDRIYAVNEIISIIAPILENYGVSRAYLFGSYARGDALPGSDIDRVWETAIEDIPILLTFCDKAVETHRMMEQEKI